MILLKPLVPVLRGLSTLAFVGVGVVLLVALLPFFEGASSYPWVMRVISFDAEMIARVRSVVPTELGRLDLARAFLAVAVLFVAASLDLGANQVAALASQSNERQRLKRRKKFAKSLTRQPKPVAPKSQKVEATGAGEKKSREELVQLMVEARRELDAMTRDVAFFALDVVESTKMKLGEDPAFVEHDFREFRKMVDAEVARGMLKSAWTPDGAMICYDSLEHAIRGAQEMLRRLPSFNRKTRMMQTPFRVRCGINAGNVQYDAATPMEEMSHNVIDVAGHMQKYADPDTIYVATDLIAGHKMSRGFQPVDMEVDGYAVSAWRGPSADV